jgi:hypothetical protein
MTHIAWWSPEIRLHLLLRAHITTPYQAIDEFMKYILVYFVQVFIHHYGGFKILKS